MRQTGEGGRESECVEGKGVGHQNGKSDRLRQGGGTPPLEVVAAFKRAAEGDFIGVFEMAADRQSMR